METTNTIFLGSAQPSSGGGSYTLPPATASTLGGVKVGQNLTVEADGTLNATGGGGADKANTNLDNLVEDAKMSVSNLLGDLYKTSGYEVVGAPTITNGVVTGFSATSYLKGAKVPAGTTKIDVVVKFKPTDASTNGAFFHLRNFYFYFSGGATFSVFIKATDEWKSQVVTFDSSVIDQFVWAHYNTTGTQQTIEISTDGINFNHTVTLNYTDDTSENENLNLGCRWSGDSPFTGYIDLNDTNVQLDEKYWFIGNSDTVKPAHLAMPSDKYIDLTIPADGTELIAPADGYFTIAGKADGTTPILSLLNKTANVGTTSCSNFTSILFYYASICCSKGDAVNIGHFQIKFNDTDNPGYLRFVYANGSKNEASN